LIIPQIIENGHVRIIKSFVYRRGWDLNGFWVRFETLLRNQRICEVFLILTYLYLILMVKTLQIKEVLTEKTLQVQEILTGKTLQIQENLTGKTSQIAWLP
jgi:hypothetical protein